MRPELSIITHGAWNCQPDAFVACLFKKRMGGIYVSVHGRIDGGRQGCRGEPQTHYSIGLLAFHNHCH